MYRRSTSQASFGSLPPALREAFERHAAERQLILKGDERCWITHSENPPASGFFGKLLSRRANHLDPDVEHDSALVLHPTCLLVGTSGAKRGTFVLSVPLLQASVTRGSGLAARLGTSVPGVADGMSITGFPSHEGRLGTYFFGLGSEPAAEACLNSVESAILAAKNPR
ncbi:MAG: hypothetical protein H6718_23335 [Polyangiaceae bacterium]|nr:hypothetical protein [Polyangiaceae bacterium]